MGERLIADALVAIHLLFVVFALAGGALVVWRARFAWLHLPAAAWAAYVEFSGTICPLTPLENEFRRRAGAGGYDGGFIEHYLLPVLYPAGLTPATQHVLGAIVVAVNVAFYVIAWRRRRNRRRRR